jgi:hypothetical protein
VLMKLHGQMAIVRYHEVVSDHLEPKPGIWAGPAIDIDALVSTCIS